MRPEHGFSRKYPYILLWGLLALALLLTSCGRQRIRQPGESGAAFENSTAPGNGAASESGGAPGCPSQEDIATTRLIRDALRTMNIQLVDHIVVADGDYVSMAASGMLI